MTSHDSCGVSACFVVGAADGSSPAIDRVASRMDG
jgi:hypothetical protein